MSKPASSPLQPSFAALSPASAAPVQDAGRSLLGPTADFFGLGGLTLVLVPIVIMLPEAALPALATLSLFLANFINHPHFAHSYQIFYRAFAANIADSTVPRLFRLRYLFAGVILPVGLAAFLITHFVQGNAAALGLAGNAMAFLVGWHYAKQGYGMLVVQCVLKRWFLNDSEKRIVLLNAHASWVFVYLLANYEFHRSKLWGIEYLVIDAPIWSVYLMGAAMACTTMATAYVLIRKASATQARVPWAGIVAYASTLYVWLFAGFNPAVILVVPALHSLQYLTVVWRFEQNYQDSQSDEDGFLARAFGDTARKRFLRFIVLGLGFGYLGFWALPEWLAASIHTELRVTTPTVFLFICWIFINIHHYFLDNVMWRRENPETGKYLFAGQR